jgi:hypothetical protein
MTSVPLMLAATLALGTIAALLVARALRGRHENISSLAAGGARLAQISRRMKMPQDIVALVIARESQAAKGRQNVPASAGTAPAPMPTFIEAKKFAGPKPMNDKALRNGGRGTNVAL